MSVLTRWFPGVFESEIAKIVNAIGRMPTNSELSAMGRGDIASQITRKGGFRAVAKEIGADIKHSDSDTGWEGESELLVKLTEKGFAPERMKVKSPYDITVCGCVRIDVKAARFAEYGVCKGWFYRIGKHPQADVIALYQLDTGVAYFLPWTVCPCTNVTISKTGGKYSMFRDRYDIIEELVETRCNEHRKWQKLIS